MLNLDAAPITIPCPCGSSIKATLGDVRLQKKIQCGSCGQEITLVDENNSVRQAQQTVNHSLDQLKRSIKKLGR